MEVRVRECADGDTDSLGPLLDSIEKLHREELPIFFRRPPANYWSGFVREIRSKENSRIFVAETEGQLVGYVHVIIKKISNHPLYHPGELASVEALAVSSSVRRCGVGKQLMKVAENFAMERGFSEVELNVWNFNRDAMEFYSSLGYSPVRTHLSKKL